MRINFTDYATVEPFNPEAQGNPLWQVIDPVNANNNVVHSQWGNIELEEFAAWFADARDALQRLVAYEQAANEGIVNDILVDLFGNPILVHGDIS